MTEANTDTRALAKTRVLEDAAAELRSAYTLLADPHCDRATALPHLRAAWEALAWLSRGEVPTEPGVDLKTWLAPEHLKWLPPRALGPMHHSLKLAFDRGDSRSWSESGARANDLPSARALLSQLRHLDELHAALEHLHHGRALSTNRRLRWLTRGALTVVGVGAFVLLALRPWQSEEMGQWRAAYYVGKQLEGEPELHRMRDASFDLGRDPPTDTVPSDAFSLRLDTCLVLEDDARVAFMLTSDEGSRLLIDGELVIDNWKGKRLRNKGDFADLSAGVHHLRVEYYENLGDAALHLTASFDPNETPGPIPASMLTFPGMEFDEADPCAGAR